MQADCWKEEASHSPHLYGTPNVILLNDKNRKGVFQKTIPNKKSDLLLGHIKEVDSTQTHVHSQKCKSTKTRVCWFYI